MLEAGEASVDVEPDVPVRLFVGAGSRRLRFLRGDVTIELPEVDGPSVRIDPFLRAAGLRPDPQTTWRVTPEAVAGFEVEGAVVANGLAWPAVRVDETNASRLEAAGPAGDGLWVVAWRASGRAGGPVDALAWDEGAGGASPKTLGRHVVGRGALRVAYDGVGEAWAEVLPVLDDVPVPIPLASGRVGRERALVVAADWGPEVGLAVRLRVRGVGDPTPEVDRLYALGRGVRSVLLPATPLAPMGPTPEEDPGTASPLSGTPPSVAWVPPDLAAFWGVTLEDTQGCEAGRYWVFGGPEVATLPLPAGLARAGLLVGGVWAYELAAPLDAFTAADARPPRLANWTSAIGRGGFVRGAVDCESRVGPAGPQGRFGLISSGAAPCDEASIRAAVATDACGRLILEPVRAGDVALDALRCGHWGQGSFTDAAGLTYRVRPASGPGRAAGFSISHPGGSWLLYPLLESPEVPVPRGDILGNWMHIQVDEHLERPDFPGQALLGTQSPNYTGAAGEGPFLQIRSDGRLDAAWPGATVRGAVDTGATDRGPWPVFGAIRLCAATAPSTALQMSASGLTLRVTTPGPERLARPTVRILTATFSR